MALILVGTSGWGHASWVGPFYPVGLRGQPDAWLAHYATRFRTVEITSTFDAFPSHELVEAWARAGVEAQERAGRPFEFSLKAPRALTHDALLRGDVALARELAGRFDREVLDPLAGEAILGAVLVQVPARLDLTETAIAHLQEILAAFVERRVAIELRNPAWTLSGCVHPMAEPLFTSPDVCLVQADGPGFPDVAPPRRARHAYARFHGRRAEGWTPQPPDAPRDGARYDHAYTPEELAPWAAHLRALADTHGHARAYFNNAPHGNAPANAHDLLEILGHPPQAPRPRLTRQAKLLKG